MMINRFYFSTCDEIEKQLYEVIWSGLADFKEIILFKGIVTSSGVISKVFKKVLYDNPRIFYTNLQGYVIGTMGGVHYLKPKYFFSLQAVIELQSWIDERLNEICSSIQNIEDTFSKEIFIHNYLITNVKYSDSAVSQPANAYTIAGTLLENNSVCAGVALTFKLLMDYLDIPCIVATGVATNSSGKTEGHAWNVVCIGGDYYQIDVTWDLIEEKYKRVIKYDYFNLTSQEMYISRTPDYEYPICNQREYNYFYYMKAIIYSAAELQEFMTKKIINGEKNIYFKYMFDFGGMKENLKSYLRKTCLVGRYIYWINEMQHTVFIMR